jgi:hypothetical protein
MPFTTAIVLIAVVGAFAAFSLALARGAYRTREPGGSHIERT